MGDIIKRKVMICLATIMIILALITVILCINLISEKLQYINENKVRIDVNLLLTDIEKGNYEQKCNLDYAVISLDGAVIYQKNMNLGKSINPHMIGSIGKNIYTVPVVKNGEQVATLVVNTSSGNYGIRPIHVVLTILMPLLLLIVAFIAYFILISTIRKDVSVPIKELHCVTRDILNGNMDNTVKYDYDGEIGTLCHDFELMRGELKDSFAREARMKADEKLLMASISHDLKTPLATVQGYLESICLNVVEGEDIKRYCQNALNKTMLLSKMTTDILEHSKAELNQFSINREDVYTADYFGELMKSLSADAKSKGFTLNYNEIPNIIIPLDKMRIAQVMENLIGNSIKYGQKNGHIEVNFSTTSNDFHILVKDDGQGIAAEDLPFIFNKFYRGDKARTMKVTGSGLGLSISKYIVEKHNGKIECDSILGQGTIMEFYLSF